MTNRLQTDPPSAPLDARLRAGRAARRLTRFLDRMRAAKPTRALTPFDVDTADGQTTRILADSPAAARAIAFDVTGQRVTATIQAERPRMTQSAAADVAGFRTVRDSGGAA